jgi:3-methyladenine DNA glycosylase/8-oxoguanine DNA glycosylase
VVTGADYRRTISLPNGPGVARLRMMPGENWVACSLALADLRDVTAAVQRCRRLLDLDADPLAISGYLASDPVIGPLARACPGRRSVGAVGGDEIALRAVLGQQVSVAAARRLAGQLTALCGRSLPRTPAAVGSAGGAETVPGGATPGGPADPVSDDESLTHVFPEAAAVAGLDPETLPMPRSRARALVGLAEALASGRSAWTRGLTARRRAHGCSRCRASGRGPSAISACGRSPIRMRSRRATPACCGRCGCSGTESVPQRVTPLPSRGGRGAPTRFIICGRR